MRAWCPVRPSPIVVRRFLLSARHRLHERDTQGQTAPQKTETTKHVGERSRKGRRPKTGRDGVSSLLCTLPFHDNESFAEFFCEVLRASERLARRGF